MQPVLPMLSQSAQSTREALEQLGTAAFEWKLDGARVQIHKSNDEVRVYTRNLNDVTARDLQNKDVQYTRAKGFDTFAPLGPCIAIGVDPSNLAIEGWVNGEKRVERSSPLMPRHSPCRSCARVAWRPSSIPDASRAQPAASPAMSTASVWWNRDLCRGVLMGCSAVESPGLTRLRA